MGESPDALLENRHVEIDEQSSLQASQLQVCQDLSDVDRLESVDGFDLDQDLVGNHEIDSISAIEQQACSPMDHRRHVDASAPNQRTSSLPVFLSIKLWRPTPVDQPPSYHGTTGCVSQLSWVRLRSGNTVAQSHIRKEPVYEEVYAIRGP